MGATVSGRLVWPQAYHDFVYAADCATWFCDRLEWVNLDPIGVPERSLASYFVRHMLALNKELWQDFTIQMEQRDNELAMLMLIHMPVRCIVKPQGGDGNDVAEEVSLT